MDHYEIVTETTRKHVKTTCDICGKPIYWEENESYMERTVSIEYRHGMNWPDDPYVEIFEPDICSKCFREKIYPTIAELLLPESMPWKDAWNKPFHDRMNELIGNSE